MSTVMLACMQVLGAAESVLCRDVPWKQGSAFPALCLTAVSDCSLVRGLKASKSINKLNALVVLPAAPAKWKLGHETAMHLLCH